MAAETELAARVNIVDVRVPVEMGRGVGSSKDQRTPGGQALHGFLARRLCNVLDCVSRRL